MCGYSSFDDPRLQPPEEPEMMPADHWVCCIHGNACRAQAERHGAVFYEGDLSWMNDIARHLGCGEECPYLEVS